MHRIAHRLRPLSRLATCVVVGLGLVACSPASEEPGPPPVPNLVLVTIDTLRADHLSFYGYERETTPNLSAWIDEGAVFTHAYTPLPLTDPTMSTLMTGMQPSRHGVRHVGRELPTSLDTLAEVLRTAGYATAAFLSRVGLDDPQHTGRGFDVADFEGGFDAELEGAQAKAETWQRRAPDVTDRALEWLDERPDAPFFLWLHYFDPHAYYDPPPPFMGHFADGASARPVTGVRAWWGEVFDLGLARALYDEEILAADHHLERVVRWLRDEALLDHTLFVLTSDHGESLGERGHMDHGEWLYEEQLRVPLYMRQPGQVPAGARFEAPVRLADLAPTVTELLGVEGPQVDAFRAQMDGRSLVPLMRGEPFESRPSFFESETCPRGLGKLASPGWDCHPPGLEGKARAVIDGGWKLIITPTRAGRRYELYDLGADPGETHDLAAGDPARVARLEQMIDSWWETGAAPAEKVDPEAMEQLKALGYSE